MLTISDGLKIATLLGFRLGYSCQASLHKTWIDFLHLAKSERRLYQNFVYHKFHWDFSRPVWVSGLDL
jgi:hypothetical protein